MKIAMIGSGWAANRHLGLLTTLPDVEVAGHVSPTAGHLAAAVRRWGGRGYSNIKQLLDHESIAAAWVTIPPAEHGETEKLLLERGIPFMFEKPLSADRQTGERVGEWIESAGVIVAVGYHWRAMDTLPGVRQKLAETPARMVIGHWHDGTPGAKWWRIQSRSGGQMVEQATHLFDLARHVVGEAKTVSAAASRHPRPAFADADVADTSAALMRFDEGAIGVFSATCLLAGPAAIQLQLICEGILITITQTDVTYDFGTEKRVARAVADPFLVENQAFIRAIQKGDPSLLVCSYAEALKTHRLCHEVLEASLV